MIRIKAPRVWRLDSSSRGIEPSHYNKSGMGGAPGRWISESMHRRVLALVRACCNDGRNMEIREALAALAAQAEKEAK